MRQSDEGASTARELAGLRYAAYSLSPTSSLVTVAVAARAADGSKATDSEGNLIAIGQLLP